MKLVARNKKAAHNYEILDRYETGIELQGSEVKSIRAGKINLSDSYAYCAGGQVFLQHLHISPYERAAQFAPDPYRKRKLLLHRREIGYLCKEVERKRLALVPLSIYFKKQWVKVEIGLCRGRKKYDKRQKIAEQESKKRVSALMKQAAKGR